MTPEQQQMASQLTREIAELEGRREKAAKDQDHATAHEIAVKQIGRYQSLVELLS